MDHTQATHYTQITSLGSAVPLAEIPLGVRKAWLQAEAQDLRYRTDGVAPTSSVGMLLPKSTLIELEAPFTQLKVIQTTSGGILNITYFGVLPIFHTSGAVSISTLTTAGQGWISNVGTGALAVSTLTTAGVGKVGVTGTGALSLQTLTCAGSGTVS